MTTDVHAGSAPAPSPAALVAKPAQLLWLRHQVDRWQAEGLVDHDQARAILDRYRASRRFSLARLLLGLGAVFVGVGLIWLVAANLDSLPPLARFLAVTTIWLALTAAAEVGAERRRRRGLTARSQLVEAGRLLASLAYGGVVFQAAQSLQVPAYEPSLVGFWAAGALVHAYAVRGAAPLVVGQVTGIVWLVWQVLDQEPSGMGFVLGTLVAAALAATASALHARFPDALGGSRLFEAAWRDVGVLLALVALFAAAVPEVTTEGFRMTGLLGVLLGLSLAAVAVAVALGRGRARLEPLAVLGVGLLAVGLVSWEPSQLSQRDVGEVSPGDWAQAVLSVAAYLLVATWVAILGIWRDSDRLTWLALGSLVVFTVFQSFAVFAQVIDGAWLFVVLGAVLFGAGFGFDRGRRQLEAALTDGSGGRGGSDGRGGSAGGTGADR